MAPPSLVEFLQLLVLCAPYSAVEGAGWYGNTQMLFSRAHREIGSAQPYSRSTTQFKRPCEGTAPQWAAGWLVDRGVPAARVLLPNDLLPHGQRYISATRAESSIALSVASASCPSAAEGIPLNQA